MLSMLHVYLFPDFALIALKAAKLAVPAPMRRYGTSVGTPGEAERLGTGAASPPVIRVYYYHYLIVFMNLPSNLFSRSFLSASSKTSSSGAIGGGGLSHTVFSSTSSGSSEKTIHTTTLESNSISKYYCETSYLHEFFPQFPKQECFPRSLFQLQLLHFPQPPES